MVADRRGVGEWLPAVPRLSAAPSKSEEAAGTNWVDVPPDRVTLFDGRLDKERVVVWLEPSGNGGILLASHDIGPGVEQAFVTDDLETFLTIAPTQVGRVRQALSVELGEAETAGTDADAALNLLARRYAGDSAATSHLRLWLDEHLIPYEFQMV